MIPRPDFLFRLFGYGSLAFLGVLRLPEQGSPGLWLLLAFTLAWPPLWCAFVRRWPELAEPESVRARILHALESLTVTMLVAAAGLGFWQSAAVGLLCLTGVTALGGVRLLLPAAGAVSLWLAAAGWTGGAGTPAHGWMLVFAGLTAGFLLGLAGLSFARIRRLDTHRRRALSETAALRHRNARLARYLPGELPPLIVNEPGATHRPTERFATVAFVDLVGFVELVAARPVMEIAEVLNDFMTTVAALTERRGGVVGKFLGDGVLIYFADSPEAPADQRWRGAVACTRLCLELGQALHTLTRTWRRQGRMLSLCVRVGLASGCCAIGDWGGNERLDYTLIGMPVNLASRLQNQAEPGGILLTAATAALVSADPELAARLRNLGSREIRGAGTVVVHGLNASAKVRAIRAEAT